MLYIPSSEFAGRIENRRKRDLEVGGKSNKRQTEEENRDQPREQKMNFKKFEEETTQNRC